MGEHGNGGTGKRVEQPQERGILAGLFDRAGGITRRGFAKGTLATGAAIAAITLVGCSNSDEKRSTSGEPEVVTDSSKIIDALSEYAEADLGIAATQTWSLAVGTMLFHCEGSWAAAMLAPESAVSPNTLGLLSLSSGAVTTIMETPTRGRGYSFFDLRCADGVFAWIEINYATGDWALFGQGLSGGALTGQAVQLDSGDADWEPAPFTCTGSSVIWQKMPMATGTKSSETSTCYRWNVGEAEGTGIWESTGRFATHPRVAGTILTIAPRVRNDEGTYYGMTALDLADAEPKQVDQLVLPASIRPFEAVYTGSVFAFSIEASYDSGGSLGQMGTFIGREGGTYVYFSREPAAQIMFSGSRFLIKTQSAHYLIDTETEQLQGFSSADRSIGLGDFPASEGSTATPLVFATVRDAKGVPASVTARLLTI
ncbi:MAG: hypothetical protein SOY67_07275 [Collinsella sp.]|nr:hypothetical protein [Collinsella sp.]